MFDVAEPIERVHVIVEDVDLWRILRGHRAVVLALGQLEGHDRGVRRRHLAKVVERRPRFARQVAVHRVAGALARQTQLAGQIAGADADRVDVLQDTAPACRPRLGCTCRSPDRARRCAWSRASGRACRSAIANHRQPDLPHVAGAVGRARLLARGLHRRQQQPDQQPDDRDHDQQLDQRESAGVAISCNRELHCEDLGRRTTSNLQVRVPRVAPRANHSVTQPVHRRAPLRRRSERGLVGPLSARRRPESETRAFPRLRCAVRARGNSQRTGRMNMRRKCIRVRESCAS